MNLEQYRVHRAIIIDKPIKCIVARKTKGKKNFEIQETKVSLYQTVGLAHDNTIIFLGKDERGERFAINEKQIK